MRVTVDLTPRFLDAIKAGDLARVEALLAEDPELPDAAHDGGVTPLMLAIYVGREEMIEVLMAGGAEVDVFAASAMGSVERIEELLAASPELVKAHSADGWTPLHLAAHFGRRAAAEALLARGADVRARSTNGMANTALHAALAGRHRDVVELLLARGADVNARQRGGYTALHAAAQHGDAVLTKLLVARGAEPALATDDGQTALALATAKGHDAVTNLLRQAGATA